MTLPPLFRWSPGRQGTGYRKLPLARGKTWDAYVLDYPVGSSVPWHRDIVAGKCHWRLNVVLWGDRRAFEITPGPLGFRVLLPWLGVVLFRPDHVEHRVRASTGRRAVFSVGWVRT